MNTKLLSLLLFLSLSSLGFSQSDQGKQLERAKDIFFKGNYQKSVILFERILEVEPENTSALYYGGISHLETYNSEKGLEYLQKAIEINPEIDKKHQLYWLGVANHFNYNFALAKRNLLDYRKNLDKEDPMRPSVEKWLREISLAQKPTNINARYWVEALPEGVNTFHSEHSPVISKDGATLIYTARDAQGTGGIKALDYYFYEDIFMVKVQEDGSWSTPEPISDLLNTDHHDASCQLFDNDTKMLLYRWEKDGDLFVAEKVSETSWSTPKRLPKEINSNDFESHGFITEDGNSIYFTSNKGNLRGDLDIYVSYKDEKGDWKEAVKLGINSPFDEDAPLITPDGKILYFSSRGHDSMGGFDIFRSDWDERRRTWKKPVNLGAPMNTPEDDSYLVLESHGNGGYFSSNRRTGVGLQDLYHFGKIFDMSVRGRLINSENKSPIGNASMVFVTKEYGEKFEVITDEAGNYNLKLPSDLGYSVAVSLNEKALGTLESTIPMAKNPMQLHKQDFSVSYKEDPRIAQDIRLKGTVKDLFSLDLMDGTIEVRDEDSQEMVGTFEVKNGVFNNELKVASYRNLVIDFYKENLYFPKADRFTTSRSKEITRNFKVGNGQTMDLETLAKKSADDKMSEADKIKKMEEDAFGDESEEVDTGKYVALDNDGNTNIDEEIVDEETLIVDKVKGSFVEVNKLKETDKTADIVSTEKPSKKFFYSERTVYFGYGETGIRKPIERQLDKVVESIKADPSIHVLLEGHTDGISSASFNIQLSKSRALAIFNYLKSQGVPASNITYRYFGESKPILPNTENGVDSPQNRQKNRRVDVKLERKN
jgi:outer membrane protein OmpA-like peptidoglycan-associated protein/tetratricopeptide (TPR) repeat protein